MALTDGLIDRQKKKKSDRKKFLYIALLFTVPAIWGYAFIVMDDVLDTIGVCTILGIRFALAGVILYIARLALKKTKVYGKFTKREIVAGLIAGVVNYFGFHFQSVGLLTTNTAKSGMVTGTYVVLVPLAYCAIRKKFDWRAVLYAGIFLIGMCFLFDLKELTTDFTRGDALTLLCAVFFAAQIILVDRFTGSNINVFNFSIAEMFAMGGCGLIGALLSERSGFSSIPWSACLPAMLYLTVFSSAYCYLVQTFVQGKISPSLAAILLSLESLSSVIFSLIFGRVGWTWQLGVACVVMTAAFILSSLSDQKLSESDAPAIGGDEIKNAGTAEIEKIQKSGE